MDSKGGEGQRLPSLNARMRMRRAQLGLTGADLAQRAGISASYVSLIEKGAKVPDEGVAVDLARALGDDEELYRGWARAARLGLDKLGLLNQLEAISRTPAYVNLVESGQALPNLDSTPALLRQRDEAAYLRARLHEVASRLSSPPVAGDRPPTVEAERTAGRPSAAPVSASDVSVEPAVIRVPVLAEGTDPRRLEARATSPAIRNQLLVDRRLVAQHEPAHLFAYKVAPGAMKHLRGVAAPGDVVVFRQGGNVVPDRICAVRTSQGIVLARVLFKDRSLLLLPGEGESDFASVDVEDPKALQDLIAGTHVLLIRR